MMLVSRYIKPTLTYLQKLLNTLVSHKSYTSEVEYRNLIVKNFLTFYMESLMRNVFYFDQLG